ncbi:MAG: DNA-directed RNA polymerase subunit A' [Candidatus ainarchaeum sp.]|nr:DNA-directed RNA polymerase subunit A' [Candidatus ainarchaeum sp.]
MANNVAADKMIEKIKFSLFSPDMVRKMSAAKISVPDTYNEDGYPIDGGLVDQRMGVIDPGLKCKTCGGKIRSCPGHFAHIELVRPVIHPEFAKVIHFLLKATCEKCHRLLIPKKQAEEFAAALEEEETSGDIISSIKKVGACPYCGAKQADVKFEKPTTFVVGEKQLLPTDVRDMLAEIPDGDMKLLGFDPAFARPEWVVLTALMVPPVTVRPSITLETGERSEDDLTHKLVDIMRINQRLEANINAGAPQLIIEDLWELLQYHVTTYFNNETAGIPPARHRSGRPLKTLLQRLKGKEGRFRYNLSGKRVNFSARTVISPDPMISINEVGVPVKVAEELSVPVKVTPWNIEECKKMVLRTEFPLVNYVIRPDAKRKKVTEKSRQELSDTLEVGCTIERQLGDGDIVLFNRQPSLHRISIMAHRVRIMPGQSFRLNLAVTPPYNADFDGDEMNLHVPQTEEAQVEAEVLMKVQGQIISPRHGHAIIKGQEDHVSGAFFLTRDGVTYDKRGACDVLAIAGITELPKPDMTEGGKERWSGKLLFSQLLPKGLDLEYKSKLGEAVKIRNGLLVSGTIESKGFENELIERIARKFGPDAARGFVDDATKISLYAISRHGFSVSLENYTLPDAAMKRIADICENAKKEVDGLVMQYKKRTLERLPGRSLKETLEERIMEVLSKARNACGKVVEESLGMTNTSILMAKIGARGSLLNAIQMGAMVGQQAVRSKRIYRGYKKRPLLHYKRGDIGAEARGFVISSFTKGLTPEEFFFHSMGGRESLVNTAIRTARSGYMQRRLINALQDLVVQEDRSVRDSRGTMVEFVYGGDGLDPMKVSKELVAEMLTSPERE